MTGFSERVNRNVQPETSTSTVGFQKSCTWNVKTQITTFGFAEDAWKKDKHIPQVVV